MRYKSLTFFFVVHLSVFAQEAKKDSIGQEIQQQKRYSLVQFGRETISFIVQPIKWTGNDWLKAGATTALTVGIMPFDEKITTATEGQGHYYSAPVEGGRIYGEWYSLAGAAGGFGLYGLMARDNGSKKIAAELLQAGLYTIAVTEVLKVVIGRERPVTAENAYTYHPFTFTDNDFHSMPSGHTSRAFALSTVLSRNAHSTALKILAFVPAGFTMFSRIYQHQHWLSDQIPAAALGFFVGNWVVDLREGKTQRVNISSIYPPAISISLDRQSARK